MAFGFPSVYIPRMSVQKNIEAKIKQKLAPVYLEVINESFMHSVPPGSESHFKVIVVSDLFAKRSLVEQHRMVNEILAEELKESVHALSMQTFTPEEWKERGRKILSTPPCLGGKK